MSEHLPKYHKLLVISDTSMRQDNDGVYAFGPVVKELEELSCFKTIVWIGFNRSNAVANKSLVKLSQENIKLILLPSSGGKTALSKLYIILLYPLYFFILLKEVYNSKCIHVRAPSNPGVIAMLLSKTFFTKKFWFKYAGDWIGKASPFYMLQRKMLMQLSGNSVVTVNGNWANQPKHIIGFENPCLDNSDRVFGEKICKEKELNQSINYCFVGGMNTNKGVDKIIKALEEICVHENFGTFHFVGGGELLETVKNQAGLISDKIICYDFLPKQEISKIYKECHFIVLPSKSEGFPKVIGEAMNYGCVPIVSDVSCIGQYIEHYKNGFLINPITTQELQTNVLLSLNMSNDLYKRMVHDNYMLSEKFTYSYYQHRIVNTIFK